MQQAQVVIVGSGFAGLCMGIRLKQAGVEPLILEKENRIGGTWRDNTYPGCACDTQSHHYSFSFERNPDWSRTFSTQPEILAYLEHCAQKYDLFDYIRFQSEVTTAQYDQDKGHWLVHTRGGERFTCSALVSAVGQLNHPVYPDIPGLDQFKGAIFHSAKWDHSFDLTNKRVAVIGNGASAVQLIPSIAAQVSHLKVFQRSANWLVPRNDKVYSKRFKWGLRNIPLLGRAYRYYIYWLWEWSWPSFVRNSKAARKKERERCVAIQSEVNQQSLAEVLTPDYEFGCKRILLSDDYYSAIQRSNVELVTDGIESITADGLKTRNGQQHIVDCIVLATGFKSWDFLAPMRVEGEDGALLSEVWGDAPEAYLGIAVAGFPNLFILYGPNTNLGHNSIIFMIECQVNYVLRCIKRLLQQKLHSLSVKPDAMARFNHRLHNQLNKTAWVGSCNSWYKSADGRVINNWSSHTISYWWRTRRPDWNDFKIRRNDSP